MDKEIEIRHLRYFLAVAETLHFGKAAVSLGIQQPPLSQQIRNLERILGYTLFDRTTRGVRLTRVGQFFVERARNTVAKMRDDVEMARRLGAGKEGVLDVGFSGSVMFTTLPKGIEKYRRMYPNVELRLRELVTAEQIPALLEGSLAIGFLRDCEAQNGLSAEPVLREPYIAALPSNHRLARETSISPIDLKEESFVFFARSAGNLAYDRTVACCEAAGFRPNIVQHCPQWPTALQLVAAGLGVSLAPACVAGLKMPGVVYRKLRSRHWTSIDIGMKAGQKNPAAEEFLRIVRPVLKQGQG
ncbi:MAG TPA: LysR family transcriptional regulator [Terriglobales bacterium]|nr:LysR family transcriptional regulator [Terriglobales bacterium]